MTEAVDLPTMIQVARRWADRERTDQARAIVTTLEWLYTNEAKIKAKVETVEQHDAEPMGDVESVNTYRLTGAIFLEMAKGGWERRYNIVDDSGAVIGLKVEGCKTRADKPYVYFEPAGYECFQTAKAFIAAYEAGAWKARETGAAA